jgi:hypothetical protein
LLQPDAADICEARRFDGMMPPDRIATSNRRTTMKFPVRTPQLAAALIAAAISSGFTTAHAGAVAQDQHGTSMKTALIRLAMGPVSAPKKPGGTGGAQAADPPPPVHHKSKYRRH